MRENDTFFSFNYVGLLTSKLQEHLALAGYAAGNPGEVTKVEEPGCRTTLRSDGQGESSLLADLLARCSPSGASSVCQVENKSETNVAPSSKNVTATISSFPVMS